VHRVHHRRRDHGQVPARRATPVYEELPGWRTDITAVRSFDALPQNAKRYVHFIEERIRTPITWISVGPNREQTIRKMPNA
jgi:adenylosuccinate synthase